jgi:Mrp family chromosome partitioning ATPase
MRSEVKSIRSQQFGQLRARIEATFSSPAVLVVTSAVRGDGKTVTAFGLADSLAQAHHRVLLVDTNAEAPTLARIHHLPGASRGDFSDTNRAASPVAGQRFEGLSLADQRFEAGTSMDSIKAAVSNMRLHYDFVIVDTSALIKSDLAVLFSSVADATLLTLRLGRLPSRADEQTMATLRRTGANVVGLLTVEPAMIKNFAVSREEILPTIRVPARHVTSRHTIVPEGSYSVDAPRAKVTAE